MPNTHRQHIISKFIKSRGRLDISQLSTIDITQLLLMISNVHDDHEERTEDVKLPIYMEAGVFHLKTCNCWNGCGGLAVAADHPTYCQECEEQCELTSRAAHEE